ncbi:MAG: hypothetical protein ABJF10_16460 [Chthoniobacter sp.]|uniref:hypothetical protein n=1 Tax=Chthoniobacter sp. TaxID=2510640 RepID=UPI0032A5908B
MKPVLPFLLLASLLTLASCASQPPKPAPGRKLQLETIRHDFGTTYLYRDVADPAGSPAR